MNILALDTTGKVSTCALMMEDTVVAHFDVHVPLTHSETAVSMVEDLLRETQVSLSEIELLAVANGPGSFTGVRIGVSFIKGLGMARGLPCMGISSLAGLAENLAGFSGFILPAMDARRGQVYGAVFRSADGKIERVTEDLADDAKVFLQNLPPSSEPVWILGDGAQVLLEASSEAGKLFLAPEELRLQKASSIARLAREQAEQISFKTLRPENLEISYLRFSQAERERMEKESNKK